MSGCFCRDRGKPPKTGLSATVTSGCSGKGQASFFALAFSAVLAPSALAETVVWVGSPTDDWFLASSWYGYTRVPGSNDTASINSAGPTIAAGTSVNLDGLVIGVDAGGTMSVNGALSTVSTTLGSSAGFSGRLDFSGATWSNDSNVSVGSKGIGDLRLSGSSAVSGGNIYIGETNTGQGAFVLDNSSSLENSGTVFVGYGGSFNLLEVLDASRLETGELVVADGAGENQATVKGQDSSLTASGNMVIGNGGRGIFTIVGGGAVTSRGNTIVGNLESADGSALNIDGAGSLLKTEGTLVVGNMGAATMSVGTAAAVLSGTVVIGRHSGSSVTIKGGGTKWTTDGLLIGGDASDPAEPAGNGRLEVTTGGKVESTSARLGIVTGATGAVTVDGGGSGWTVGSAGLGVGIDGIGSLGVSGGGVVDSATTVLAVNPGSSGSATVSGSGSILRNAGDLYVGGAGEASLHIEADGVVISDSGYVAQLSGSISSVTVSGGGSKWTLGRTLIVGHQSGTMGDVSVTDGGGIQAGQLALGALEGSSGSLMIRGAGSEVTVKVDNSLAYSGYMDVGYDGSGSLIVSDAASLDAYQLYLGTKAGSSGTLHVIGTGSRVEIGNALTIGSSGSGTVEVAGDGSLAATTIFIAFEAGSTGVLNIGATAGQTAYAAGTVEADTITFGAGNGRIVLNHSETNYTLSADISGAGHVDAENGVTILNGDNTYSGGTTISGGTLKGSATSFGSGRIANDAQLVVDGAGTLSNVISGSGTVEKTGSGNLVLTGNNSYSGGTAIAAGTLTGGATGFGSGEIINNAQLVVEGAGIFSNVVSGTGAFEKTGDGNLVLSGDSTYTGVTEVSSGKLSVNGSLVSTVFVDDGATLGGSGTIGGLTVASGGTLSPGNSVGTLTSTGDVTFASGSVYAVEIDASGNSDRLDVNGTITIGNNVNLVVTTLSSHSAYSLGTRYTILTATGGVSGVFSSIDENFAYLIASVTKSTDGGTAYLSFTRTSPEAGLLASATSTENAGAANAVEALGEAAPLYQAAVFLQQGEAQSAFSQLAGALQPSLAMALISRSQLTRDVILDRMRSAFNGIDARPILPLAGSGGRQPENIGEDHLTFWSSGFGSRSRLGGDGHGFSVETKGGGVLFGVDGDWDNGWRTGLAAGYGHDTVSQIDLAASANVDSYYLAAYAGTAIGPTSLRFGAIHAFQNVETQRAISFSTLKGELAAGYDASTTQAFAEAAWRFDFDPTHVEPYANISYVNTHTDAFREVGGIAAVSSGPANHGQLYTTLGARIGRDFAVEGGLGRAMFDVAWRHGYGDRTLESRLFYDGGSGFSVASAATARDAALLNVGLSYDLNPFATLTFRYGAVFGAGVLEQSAFAELGVRF
ncbi:autotransporter domain-containing protein [Agrobacterium sp. T29]|uniref:autotransporter domain-containing protein n=1 Tax=Agrobacterium sp. T29 TaxID=2580515 RepID=UPI00115F229B|nr:autotransporter domain-containing protein [Agrobacterium sp. T29]